MLIYTHKRSMVLTMNEIYLSDKYPSLATKNRYVAVTGNIYPIVCDIFMLAGIMVVFFSWRFLYGRMIAFCVEMGNFNVFQHHYLVLRLLFILVYANMF